MPQSKVPLFLTTGPDMMDVYALLRRCAGIDNVTKSPIYAHFGETLAGCVTIRAFGDSARFVLKSNAALDRNVQASYLMNCGINRWLMFYTQGMIGTISLGITAVLAAATGQVGASCRCTHVHILILIHEVTAYTYLFTRSHSIEYIVFYHSRRA